MKRRRRQLQVSTFPFLAVLLCAMGALILVLLAMDRKSKMAAQQKAREKVSEQHRTHQKTLTARNAEYDARSKAMRTTWEKKRDDLRRRVGAEEAALDQELQRVQVRLAVAAKRLADEQVIAGKLRDRVKQEEQALAKQEEALASARLEAGKLAEKLSTADDAKSKLAADLVILEKQLDALRKAQASEAEAHSIVPYTGTRGAARRPIYVECVREGLVFHPDEKRLPADVPRSELHAEIEGRVKAVRESIGPDYQPFVMLLARPDGIGRYYLMQMALRDLKIEYGYELVEQDWKFHFPDPRPEEANTRAMQDGSRAVRGGGPKQNRTPDLGGSEPGQGIKATILPPRAYGMESGIGPAALPSLWGTTPAGANGGPNTALAAGPFLPESARAAVQESVKSVPHVAGSPQGARREEIQGPSLFPESGPAAKDAGTRCEGGACKTDSANPVVRQSTSQEKAAPRPAAIGGGGTFIVHVECRQDHVLVHPRRKIIDIHALNRSANHNPLLKAVEDLIDARLARVPQGQQPPRVEIHYLVHGDSLQTYHLTYPALSPVRVAQKAFQLRPEDDVSRLVGGH